MQQRRTPGANKSSRFRVYTRTQRTMGLRVKREGSLDATRTTLSLSLCASVNCGALFRTANVCVYAWEGVDGMRARERGYEVRLR